jgi:uncharacterized protein YggE
MTREHVLEVLHPSWRLALMGATIGIISIAGAATAPAAAGSDAVEAPPTISVSGTGVSAAVPDEASLRLAVSVRGGSAAGATSRAATRMSDVIDALGTAGIADEDIQTTGVGLRRVTKRDPQTGRQVPNGWQASNTIHVIIRDIEQTGDIVDDAIAAGASSVDRLRFFASDPSAALEEARTAAVDAAALSATQLATAAGVQVGPVRSMSEAGESYPVIMDPAFRASGAALQAATPVAPGTIDISVTVYIEYAIS